jgi:pimeloyl-ACP methyl ester carboxylesterase
MPSYCSKWSAPARLSPCLPRLFSQSRMLIASTALVLVGILSCTPPAGAATPGISLDAPNVPNLDWKTCIGQNNFQCATARVPLDYRAPHGATIELAVIRHRATDQAHRIGSLFWNPGGPGAGGVATLPLAFALPTTPAPFLFPIPLRTYFDIISWDPRGVGNSTAVLCFDKDKVKNAAAEAAYEALLPAGTPSTPLQQRTWIAGYAGLARFCGNFAGKILDHVSTTETAEDLDLLRQAVGAKKLTYQGNSYGTFLGATYANLFPDNVRAMALLGNINAVAWTHADPSNPLLDGTLRQTADIGSAQTLDAFLTNCGQVSAGHCAFSAGSATATHQKWATLLQRVTQKPVTINGQKWDYDHTVTISIVTLYEVRNWPALACDLQQVWQGGVAACPPALSTSATGVGFAQPTFGQLASQILAIRCAEVPNPQNARYYFGLADLATYRSGAVGPYWTWSDEECVGWQGRAAESYVGPWNKRTPNPILLINTLADPATPYRNAVFMERTLGNARLLTIAGYGHADGGTPSTCANNYLVNYFFYLKLPPGRTVCPQDLAPFSTTGTR